MCLLLYLASDAPLPLVAWNKQQPGLHVEPVRDGEEQVRRQFQSAHVVRVGSHQGCGCGFLKEYAEGEEFEAAQADYAALADYLSPLRSAGTNLEFFYCWDGDQGAEPAQKSVVSVHELSSPDFVFTEKAYYRIA